MSHEPSAPDGFDFHGDGLDDIFEMYGDMRRGCPVAHSDKYGKFWALTRYSDIHTAERDWQTYSVKPSMILPAFGTDRPMIPLDLDPPQHTEFRKLLLPYFTPARIDALEVGARRTARALMAELVGGKSSMRRVDTRGPFPRSSFLSTPDSRLRMRRCSTRG